ncbi:MAG: hypothetical protein NZ805_11240 [Armatimonadetes bacterium]|nr:hypothetical protein [Armatimonadota bacterium]MDW8029622.1 hypothetical protein [Armatimonadota bacterium]
MLDKVRHLADKVLKMSKADKIEVVISGSEETLTRFAENVIYQNVARSKLTITFRAFAGKRMA